MVSLNASDDWIRLMCQHVNPACPPHLRGIYWMQGNTMPETLVTIHEADWSADGKTGVKRDAVNWTKDPTCGGWILDSASMIGKHEFRLHKDWLETVPTWGLSSNLWLYFVQPGDRFYDAQGRHLKGIRAGMDAIRYVFSDSGEVVFQYHMRKIVEVGHGGQATKVEPAFTEFLSHYSQPKRETCAPFYCNEARNAENPVQILRAASPPHAPSLMQNTMTRA